jgi:hypothetical protein
MMKKYPTYNPLAMSSQQYSNAYGQKCRKINKIKQNKQIQENRNRLNYNYENNN